MLVAYAYLLYIFITFPSYDALLAHFSSVNGLEWLCLLIALALVPVNMLAEAWKWRYLLQDLTPLSWAEAQRQVYYGCVGAFVTPGRLGDYPTRVTRLPNRSMWLPAIALGFVGTMALSTVNILGGVLSILVSGVGMAGVDTGNLIALAVVVLLLFVLILLFLPRLAAWAEGRREWGEKMQSLLSTLRSFSPLRFPILFVQSVCRYLVYAVQLWLVLEFCGVGLSATEYLQVIPIHYLMVTLMPSVPAADAAVRGSVGTLIFSLCTSNTAGVAISMILLWVINTIIPVLIGTFIKKK